MNVESIVLLKKEGNDFFKAGLKETTKQSPVRKQHFIDACLKYAAALEAIVAVECTSALPQLSIEQFAELKPNLFINLGMTNFQLDDFKESRRCCNAAIAFINDAGLRMNELGEHHDINIDKSINQPIVRSDTALLLSCSLSLFPSLTEFCFLYM